MPERGTSGNELGDRLGLGSVAEMASRAAGSDAPAPELAHLPECILERAPQAQWHVAKGEGSDTFQPILCADEEGVNMPGNRVRRQPTCISCYARWRQERAA